MEGAFKTLELDRISVSFEEQRVLMDFSMRLALRERAVLTGPSGIGKTTIFRIIEGFLKPESGSVRVEFNGGKKRRLRISSVFQEERLCEDFSAVENVCLVSQHLLRQEAEEVLGRLLPVDSLSQPVRTLSGGMRRRVSVVRALLSDSDLLLMDEPFSGLDTENRARTLELILELQRNRALLVSAHSIAGLPGFREIPVG